eukprot:IDg813t1
MFETLPFFVAPQFIIGDVNALRVGDKAWHNPRRFRQLPDMRVCVELYAFAPWLHPGPVANAFDQLRKYCVSSGVLPGETDFRRDKLPRQPEEFPRALYLQEFMRSRASWVGVPDDTGLLAGVDAWQLIDETDSPYLRQLTGDVPACSVGVPDDLVFDSRFVFFGNRLRHDFRFHHGLEVEASAMRTNLHRLRAVAA